MSDSESSTEEQIGSASGNQMPTIQPIQTKPPKKRIYTRTTEKMRERNLAASRKAQEKRAETKAKLAEYELLKQVKTISKEDAEELLNNRFNALEQKLKELTQKQEPVPVENKVLPIIQEEPEDTSYLSSGSTDSQKRRSGRFAPRDISPSVSRLSERFKRF